jgi:hypothetical protein
MTVIDKIDEATVHVPPPFPYSEEALDPAISATTIGFQERRGQFAEGAARQERRGRLAEGAAPFRLGLAVQEPAAGPKDRFGKGRLWRFWRLPFGDVANNMKKSATTKGESPSRLIDARIKELDDWRGKMLSHVRALIRQADPEVVEEWKWSVPVWSHDGLICTGETYKSSVKLTFAKGASLKDPSGLFNSSLEGNARRAIDFHEGDEIDEDAFKTLIRAAAALNRSSAR